MAIMKAEGIADIVKPQSAIAGPLKAPFPYFGGKSRVAHIVWRALGQPAHYIEPFCGSCAVLLCRPDWEPRMVETVNDADGHIANVWRALQFSPDETARWADWPVNHADLMARKKALNQNTGRLLENLVGDETWHDPVMAGYYIWAVSCSIGNGLACPMQRPHLSDGGMGVHQAGIRPAPTLTADVRAPYNTGIYAWFRELSERLRYVRVVCGDWSRVCGGNWQDDLGTAGIFFDPPYGAEAYRDGRVYRTDSLTVAADVQRWCLERGGRSAYRIVLAGYYEEHEALLAHGWTAHRWVAQGGYGNRGRGNTRGSKNRFREALFMSPHCLPVEASGVPAAAGLL